MLKLIKFKIKLKIILMDPKNSYSNGLLISESNYSEFCDETLMKMKNDKSKRIYKLDEKEKDLYDQQEEQGKKMLELISNKQKEFKHKYNKLDKEHEFYHKNYDFLNDRVRSILEQNNLYTNRNTYRAQSNSELYSNLNRNQSSLCTNANTNRNQNYIFISENNSNYSNSNENILSTKSNRKNKNIDSVYNYDNYLNNNNGNFMDLSNVFDNKWIFPKNETMSNKKFKEMCTIKSWKKK